MLRNRHNGVLFLLGGGGWNSRGYSLGDEKGVILVNLKPRGTTVNSNCYTETPRILNACLHWVHPTRKVSEELLLHYVGDTHKYEHQNSHHKFWMDSVATSTVQTCVHTIRFSPAGFLFFWGGGGGKEKEVGEACEDTIIPMKRHCWTPSAGGCTRTASFTRWEHMRFSNAQPVNSTE